MSCRIAATAADRVYFLERKPIRLAGLERTDRASSSEHMVVKVGAQRILDGLGIALADGLDGVLVGAANELLVDQQAELVPRHDPYRDQFSGETLARPVASADGVGGHTCDSPSTLSLCSLSGRSEAAGEGPWMPVAS